MRTPSPRRDFLARLGLGAAAAAAGAALPAPLRAAARPSEPRVVDAAAERLAPVDGSWDVSWIDRLTGKHRAVFDSPTLSEGDALFRAIVWRDHHREVYGTALEELNAVLVVRHAAIPLVMNDAFWQRFKVGKAEKLRHPATKKWWEANPIRTTVAGTPAKWADYNLERFLATGGVVLACNMAFNARVVSRFMEADKLDHAAAEQRAKEHLIPGIVLQPSGVFAALRAQEAGCHYLLAS
jgi:hypothetical protein